MNNLSKSELDGKISMFVGIGKFYDKGKVLENSTINNDLRHVGRFIDQNINDENVSPCSDGIIICVV
ncbi:MAG TPA: hypothetical protein VEH06_15720 [Candidatus Bathyarchaeia archaeon]|nr:hypothetical protein [Candidatus Bathyarchaeia archaeon]